MKYGKLKTLIIAAAAGILMVPVGGVRAETNPVKQSRSEFFGYSWDGATGDKYPAPYEIDEAPGYVPFNNVFANSVAGSISSVLTNSKGADVGVEITRENDADTTSSSTTSSSSDTSDTTDQAGSIWNTSGNELDLTSNFHATMQFYLGEEGETESGDGIAFVMAKDLPTKTLPGGGALGIWGDLAAHDGVGMPNSFAIAIDTNNNADKWDTAVYSKTVMTSQAGNETYFSNTPNIVKAQTDDRNYIGYGYPGQTNQFQKITTTNAQTADKSVRKIIAFNGNGNVYGKNGTSQIGMGGFNYVPKGYLNNGAWHQLDINYKSDGAGGGTFTYTVTLKNTDGTQEMAPISNSIHWKADDLKTYFGGTKVNWGFTGATGAKFENGVVAFQNIPGLLNNEFTDTLQNSDDSEITDSNPIYVGDVKQSTYQAQYIGVKSKQSWPAATDGTLSAILNTGSNFGFILKKDADGSEYAAVRVVKPNNEVYDLKGVPEAKSTHTLTKSDGSTVRYATSIRIQGIHRFDISAAAASQALKIPTIATQVGPKEIGANAGVIGGDNGLATAKTDFPAVQVRPLSLDYVPSFVFPQLTVADVIGGVTVNNTAANSTEIKDHGIGLVLPGDANFTLSAKMDSFNFGSGYVPGSTSLSFNFYRNGTVATNQIVLKDDPNVETTVYAGTKSPVRSTVTGATLKVASFPKIKAGKYSSTITWTLSATPTSAPAG